MEEWMGSVIMGLRGCGSGFGVAISVFSKGLEFLAVGGAV